MENKKKAIILTIIAVSCLLVVVFGATYAYFQVLATNNVTGTNTQGSADTMPKGTLVTNITSLKINLDADLMSEENAGVTYYATESGVPVTTATEGSGRYVLATASLDKSGLSYDCSYSYTITATSKKAITDGSDADVKVRITGSNGYTEIYTLQDILNNVSKTYNGKITSLTYGENQKIYVEAYVENTDVSQDDLAGNEFTFTLALVENSFKCDLPQSTAFAEELIASGELWQSGLEDDGYRYYGTGEYQCSYNNGNYVITGGISGCSEMIYDDDWNELTLDTDGQTNLTTVPNNYICFGTTDKTECKNNESKYMYRIIGVFEGNDGEQHLKLISFKPLGAYAWHSDEETDTDWVDSDLYTGLNGEYFLTNATYDYLQNNAWLDKIEDWTWTAVNNLSCGLDNVCGAFEYYNSTPVDIYLYEMNRSSKTVALGEWTTPIAKVGLMYASDYALSLGNSALSYTSSSDYEKLATGWIHISNNDPSVLDESWGWGWEWTISRSEDYANTIFYAVDVTYGGTIDGSGYGYQHVVRPVVYLTSDVAKKGGTGTYADPYILIE